MSLSSSMVKIFAQKTYARQKSTEKRVSEWLGKCSLNGQAPMAEKALTHIFTGIQGGRAREIKKGVKALGPVKLNSQQIQVSLLLAESLYLAGLCYPQKKEKTKKQHYFVKAVSLCREIIGSDADLGAKTTARTILGKILLLNYDTLLEGRAMLKEAGSPVALIALAEHLRQYYGKYSEAIECYETALLAPNLPANIQAIVKNNLAVVKIVYCIYNLHEGKPYDAQQLIGAITNMEAAATTAGSIIYFSNLRAVCNRVKLLERLSNASGSGAAVSDKIESAMAMVQYMLPLHESDEGVLMSNPTFRIVPDGFAIDSIPAKAN